MKKTLLTAIILLTAVMAQAQNSVKINPVLKVGMQKTYTTRGEATTPGTAAADVSGEVSYKVAAKTTDGYQIDMVTTVSKIDATQMIQNMNAADIMQLLNSMNVELLTDKKGALTGIKNSKELIDQCNIMIDSLFNSVINQSAELKDNKEFKANIQKGASVMKDMITENYLMETFTQTPSITMLNGKTITEGMQEDGMFSFFKTKTTYSILNSGKTIVQDTKADIDMQSMKAYLLKIMDSMMPESVAKETNPEQLSGMIENMISNGTLKMDMNRKTTYDIGDDGWVKKLVMQMDMNIPGQSSKVRQVITLKD